MLLRPCNVLQGFIPYIQLFKKAFFSLSKPSAVAFWAMKGFGKRNIPFGFILGRKSLFSEQEKL